MRLVDAVISTLLLVILSPLLLVLILVSKISSPGPVFYGGERIGRGGRPFRMWKFRTMIVNADKMGASSTSADDARLTGVGRWMRRYKLDEVPQLWNVLRGDMSLVGPRPQVAWAVARYTDEERVLLTVRPGITDPASLRFANEAEILRGQSDPDEAYYRLIHPEKMRLSIEYVRTRTAAKDAAILFATLAAPFMGAGRADGSRGDHAS